MKKRWQNIKKDLPKNWAQEVSKALNSKGIIITPTQVSDIKNGRIKNLEMSKKVLEEIKKLKSKHLTIKKNLKTIL